MELVAIVRVLWDRKVIVALGAFVAVAAGVLAGQASSQGSLGGASWVGSARLLLDTQDSQLVTSAPVGADTLAMRAALLGDTLSTDGGRATVADAAGVPETELIVLGPSTRIEPPVGTPLVARTAAAGAASRARYVVEVFADQLSPVIAIEAHAPDRAGAATLVQAAAAALRSSLRVHDASQSRGFVLDTVSTIRTKHRVSASHRELLMLASTVVTFGVWCGSIVLCAGITRSRRRVASTPKPA